MKVFFEPGQPHVLVLEAETADDIDVVGWLSAHGPLMLAERITRRQDAGWLVVGLKWDMRNCPRVGRAVSDEERLLRDASGELARGLGKLIGLSLRDLQRDGIVKGDAAAPHANE